MLAFRYGIAIEKDTVLAYFVGNFPALHKEDLTTRDYCKFTIEGKTVKTVIEGNVVVTALPKGIFQDRDPIAISHMFDSGNSLSYYLELQTLKNQAIDEESNSIYFNPSFI